MCGRCLGVLWDQEGEFAKPVPHFGGPWGTQCPLEGSICLRVDHSSQRENGAEANSPFSSLAREKDLRGASAGGTQ